MKTTIELPDELLAKAKEVAAQRRITLKSMIEHALRRELTEGRPDPEGCDWKSNEFGFPVLPSSGNEKVTSELVYELLEEEG